MDNPAPIIREEHEGGGAYTMAIESAHRPAILSWKAGGADGDIRVVEHTFTPPKARGQGIALRLVEAIVADAREEGFRIAPQCPYVVRAFGKHPEWEDVRAPLPR